MNGCIYRTKHGECKDPNRDKKYGPSCRSDCTNKHPSNADRIRAMSDEELAKWIHEIVDCSSACPAYNECDECRPSLLNWLKQEATE